MGQDSNEKVVRNGKSVFSKASRVLLIVVLLIVAVICIFSSVYSIAETETAVITTFGKATENTSKGLQFKIPFIQ